MTKGIDVEKKFKGVDILVNNAGVATFRFLLIALILGMRVKTINILSKGEVP